MSNQQALLQGSHHTAIHCKDPQARGQHLLSSDQAGLGWGPMVSWLPRSLPQFLVAALFLYPKPAAGPVSSSKGHSGSPCQVPCVDHLLIHFWKLPWGDNEL